MASSNKQSGPPKSVLEITKQVIEAICNLRESRGSTFKNINKYITKKYGRKESSYRDKLSMAIKKGIAFGLIETGKPGYYKLDSGFLVAAKRQRKKFRDEDHTKKMCSKKHRHGKRNRRNKKKGKATRKGKGKGKKSVKSF